MKGLLRSKENTTRHGITHLDSILPYTEDNFAKVLAVLTLLVKSQEQFNEILPYTEGSFYISIFELDFILEFNEFFHILSNIYLLLQTI